MWKIIIGFIADSWAAIGVILGVGIMAFEAASQLYSVGVVKTDTAFWIGFGLFIFFCISAVIKFSRRASEAERKYEAAKDSHASENTKGPTASGKGLAIQGISNSQVYKDVQGSFNTYGGTPGFGVPTRGELLHKLGVEIQKFREKFNNFKNSSRIIDKNLQYPEALNSFQPIQNELLPHVNLILKNTRVPKIIKEMSENLALCKMRLGDILIAQEQNVNMPYDRQRNEKIITSIKSLDEAITSIDLLIIELMEISTSESGWWMTKYD